MGKSVFSGSFPCYSPCHDAITHKSHNGINMKKDDLQISSMYSCLRTCLWYCMCIQIDVMNNVEITWMRSFASSRNIKDVSAVYLCLSDVLVSQLLLVYHIM